MSNDAESSEAVRFDEFIDLWPSIEVHRETVVFEDPIHRRKGGFQPAVVVVVQNTATVARLMSRDVWRIGEDEIDACGWESRKCLDAIAVYESVGALAHIAPPVAFSRALRAVSIACCT